MRRAHWVRSKGKRLFPFDRIGEHTDLRLIAASCKRTDEQPAYWIAKSFQTGMTPRPVFIPVGEDSGLFGC